MSPAIGGVSIQAQHEAPANGEWPTYGGDLGATKYSRLDQIDTSNPAYRAHRGGARVPALIVLRLPE